MEQVECGDRTAAQRDAAIYPNVFRTHGLHAGSDAERHENDVRTNSLAAHGAWNSLPATGDVRRLRKPAADAFGQSFKLRTGAGIPGISSRRSEHMGRHCSA